MGPATHYHPLSDISPNVAPPPPPPSASRTYHFQCYNYLCHHCDLLTTTLQLLPLHMYCLSHYSPSTPTIYAASVTPPPPPLLPPCPLLLLAHYRNCLPCC